MSTRYSVISKKSSLTGGKGKRSGQEVITVKPQVHLAVHLVLCVHHLPSVSSVEACGVGGENGEWIASLFGTSADVKEYVKIMV